MTPAEQRRADAELRADTARLLYQLADAVQSGHVKRWQITTCAPSLAMIAHVMRAAPGAPVPARPDVPGQTTEERP